MDRYLVIVERPGKHNDTFQECFRRAQRAVKGNKGTVGYIYKLDSIVTPVTDGEHVGVQLEIVGENREQRRDT